MKTIYFVTSNKSKYKDFADRLKTHCRIKQFPAELNELQSLDSIEITKHKLNQAKNLLPNQKVIVEDRGFFIPALKNFPGPFVKMVLPSIGVDGLLKLMEGNKDRTAKFISILGYFDGEREHYFVDEEVGFLSTGKRGKNLHGWTNLLLIYGHRTFPNKTLAELTSKEWKLYMEILAQDDYLKKFIEFLKII